MAYIETAYSAEIQKAMELLAANGKVIFLGQTVGYPGSKPVFMSLKDIPLGKRIELPIMENTQMGMSIGLALSGWLPVSIYPRMDFILLAMDQLVNHLDKLEAATHGEFKPKVIIRVVIGGINPYPGPQHCADYTDVLKLLLKNIHVEKLVEVERIVPAYQEALNREKSSLLIDVADLHAPVRSQGDAGKGSE